MPQTKGETRTLSLGQKTFLIPMLALIQWLGSGCQSVGPITPTIASAPTTVSTTRPKPNDFNSIMTRLDKTSHAGVRKASEQAQVNPSPTVPAVQYSALAKPTPSTNAPTGETKSVAALTTVKPVDSPVSAAPLARPAAPTAAQTPLIMTNRAPEPEKVASAPTTVMTVKARGTNDDDADEGTATRSYAGRSTASEQDLPAGMNGSWVQRGVLSLSVGCLGAACFLLRIIRLGRFAGKVVSGGMQIASRLRT